jgi:two-component system, LuxR family, response regulator FixJ
MKEPLVFVVDDDAAVRSSLSLLLKSTGHPAATYESAQQFLAAYRDTHPGCLLLDVRMPGLSGPDLQRELNARGATIPVIFMSGHADVPMAVEAMRCGAFDFVQKPFRDQELLDRVERGLKADAARRARSEARQVALGCLDSLSPREREVMDRITSGDSNKIIAFRLGISQRTVEIHRARVMEKLDAHSVADLVQLSAAAC